MKTFLIIVLLLTFTALLGGGIFASNYFEEAIEEYNYSISGVEAFFDNHKPDPFINEAPFLKSENISEYPDERYSLRTPEGISIISYSEVWDTAKLELLYEELMKNKIGPEIELLYEIVVYPDEGDEMILGTFSPFTSSMDFTLQFPALPEDFVVGVSRAVGRIVLNGGDTNDTIESMASTLSHEYGHLFTFYHMFDLSFENLEHSDYAIIRGASRHNLITGEHDEEYYRLHRHRFLIEVAAEDYLQLMGSPTTRQVGTFVDVRQSLKDGAENPKFSIRYRNAFPQENMKIPLASEVNGLRDYFYHFIGEKPVPPVEDRQDITLDIRPVTVEHDLVSGLTSFLHYVITWNTPYEEAIYTLAYYDPDDYSGWGLPVRTVFQGQTASATIGKVTTQRGNQIHILEDSIAQGNRVFYVVAQLPDGTYYLSEKMPIQF